MYGITLEYRTCRFCRLQSVVYNVFYEMFHYSTRCYAHGPCLAKRHGTKAAREMLPEHVRKDFDYSIRTADPLDREHIKDKDRKILALHTGAP